MNRKSRRATRRAAWGHASDLISNLSFHRVVGPVLKAVSENGTALGHRLAPTTGVAENRVASAVSR